MTKGRHLAVWIFALAVLTPQVRGNGFNLNGLGSRATAMGGAYVALADDFSAVYWNPAGAAGFKNQVLGFYLTDLLPRNKYRLDVPTSSGSSTLVDARSKMTHYLGGMLAYYRPVSDRLVVGFGVYTPSGVGANWNGAAFAPVSAGGTYDWSSKIGLVSISPLIAYRISDAISVGATFNLNYGTFGLHMHAGEVEIPVSPYSVNLGQYDETMSGWGIGATFGVQVKPSDTLSFGLTVKTPSTVKFSGDGEISNMAALGYSTTSELDREITFPLWVGFGAAFRPSSRLLLSADVQWTQWSKMKTLDTEFADAAWKVLMAMSGQDSRKMDWADEAQIRFGAEYSLNKTLAVRVGYYHDPSPSPDTTLNVLLPSYTYDSVAAGFGYKIAGLQVDFGVEYLMGGERNVEYLKTLTDPAFASAMPGKYKMTMLVPNMSVGFRF
jgi:long-chain fatty acid transport protein